MKKILFPLLLLLIISGCTKIDYIGEEYPPTSNVELFFDEDDIEYDYKIMGQLVATAGDFISSEKMLEDIKKKAMEKGADGVIIIGMDRYVSGETTTYKETTKEKKNKTVTTGTTTTSAEEKKEIIATFIKYK